MISSAWRHAAARDGAGRVSRTLLKVTGKRSAMISIQMKHAVPSEYSETNRVRTGYETVLAHRTGENFACTARKDGIIEAIDTKLGIIKVRYHTVTHPELNLNWISSNSSTQEQFTTLAQQELLSHHPLYVAQSNKEKTPFKLNDLYTYNGVLLKVSDIIPLTDITLMPMHEYLPDSAKQVLNKASSPVMIKLVPITHDPADDVDIFKFGVKFTSAAGYFIKQTVVVNVVLGQTIYRGDVLAYNSGFFEQDQFNPKQVTWKHGVMANVVLMEGDSTIEDSDAITAEFSKRLSASNTHLRTLQISANTVIRDLKPVGSEVETTDLLCTLEDGDIMDLTDGENQDMLELLTSLNRKAPRARYHGMIGEIDMLYSCPLNAMHPSLASLAKQINVRKHALAVAAAGTHKSSDYAEPSQVTPGTKYHGVEFDNQTILLMFYITETIAHGAGDKFVLSSQCKSITASVIEKSISTESGYPIDMLFSGRSINNRIVLSPMIIGFSNRCLAALEDRVTDLYFK